MVGRTAASQAIQEDAALSTVEAGKLLDLLASMETIGAEDVVDLRQTQGRFVVPQLKGKLAKLQGPSVFFDPQTIVRHKLEAAQEGLPEHQKTMIDNDVLNAAVDTFGPKMTMGTNEYAMTKYMEAASLPGPDTKLNLQQQANIILDGPYYHQPARGALIVALENGIPKVLKLQSDGQAAAEEFAHHNCCCNHANVAGPIRLVDFGRDSRLTVFQGDQPNTYKASKAILLPMYCGSLDQFKQPFTESDVFKRAVPLKAGLAFVHGKGIWHNDVKPANIFVDFQGNWLLGDFGASTRQKQPRERTATMWPEQMRASAHVDMIMLANSLLLILHKRRWGDPSDVDSLRAAASKVRIAGLRNFINKLLSPA